MDYATISKAAITALYSSRDCLKDSPLNRRLQIILELRVSQINGCAFCCDMHSKEAIKEGVDQHVINTLVAWKHSPAFSAREKLMLQWCDNVTKVERLDPGFTEQLLQQFSEREVVDMTICVALMNALNRLAIGLASHE
jgi:AhpD family alkylhydroperoxidase